MVQHASFTSLIAVSSGETTGYVRVITADMEAADCHLLCLGNDAMEPVIVLYIASLTGGNDLRERIPWSPHCYVD